MQFGLGLLSGGNRGEAWGNAAQGLAYGSQADQARRQRTQEEEEQARQEEALGALLMSEEFASLPEAYRTMLTNDPELARSFVASQLEQRYAPPTAPDPTDDIQEYQYAVQQGFTGTFQEWQMQRPPSTVVNNNQPGQPTFGPVQPGWARVEDPDSPTGWRLVQEPGGAPATEAAAAATAAENRAATDERQTSVLLTNLDIAEQLANQPMTTGVDGALAANVPGTPAYDLRATVTTMKSLIGFATLQEMRDNSPTGGALGQVAVQEINYLQAAWGNLDPNQSHTAFMRQLNEVRQITLDIVEGRKTVDADGNLIDRPATATPAPAAGTPAPPTPGTVMDGYRFNGGDPADPNNWTRVP